MKENEERDEKNIEKWKHHVSFNINGMAASNLAE